MLKTIELKQHDGKPLPKSWTKSLQFFVDNEILKETYADNNIRIVRINRFSGKRTPVRPIFSDALNAVLLYSDVVHSGRPEPYPIRHFKNLRYAMNLAYPDEYYDLMD